MVSHLTCGNAVPERGVEPLCPFGQTGLSRPRIPFRHPGLGLMISQLATRPASPIILPQLELARSIQCAPPPTFIWLECPRDWRNQPDQRRDQDSGRRR